MSNRTQNRSQGFSEALLTEIRARFAHVDACPEQGERIFFENAGGALTLNSVVETSKRFAAIPDNQGRANAGSGFLLETIQKARDDMAAFMNTPNGQFFIGESGTELLFRLIMNACLAHGSGVVLGSTLEHPATRSACARWAKIAGLEHRLIDHDPTSGTVSAAAYAAVVTEDTRVATILHTSPVTGMGVDVAGVACSIREVAPECYIIVDGIQHAAHGDIDLTAYGIDGYVVSPYKVFSRHGYALAWISERMVKLPHDSLLEGPVDQWELGTRDTGAYATFSDVIAYFHWLGGKVAPEASDQRTRFSAAAGAIRAHERDLCQAMLYGLDNLAGLSEIAGLEIVGGVENPAREGLVSFRLEGLASVEVVRLLNENGIRTHLRKDDHYSGSVLMPLGWDSCVRVSMCHYNTRQEVAKFLAVMHQVADDYSRPR